MKFSLFLTDTRGSMAAAGGVVIAVAALAVGGSVDYARMVEARSSLQAAVDSATIAASARSNEAARTKAFNNLITSHDKTNQSVNLIRNSVQVSEEDGIVSGAASVELSLSFGALVNGSTTARLDASARVGLETQAAEIALVVDMSSSMVEDNRFEPAQAAVKSFVRKFADGNTALEKSKIAIVPFSSRVNFGMERQNFFRMWDGADAIPDRWLNPLDHYNDNYGLDYWIDNVTPVVTRDPHYRWIGCAEPRLDVAIKTGDIDFEPTDASPNDMPFVAMDHNPKPGTTFCPPPIQPLTTIVSTLNRAADALTSQGSTRLDAGMAAGWYTLSPKWASAWGAENSGAAYNTSGTSKVVVFMTDGGMNTQDKLTANEFDWVCEAEGDCDERAEATLLATCDAMKASGIEIYSISYGVYADREHVKKCASGDSHFFVATTDEGEDNHIDTIYGEIAERIHRSKPRLIN